MRTFFILICALGLPLKSHSTDTLYVSMDGTLFTAIDDHQSWATATRDLQIAIDSLYIKGGGEVWVKSGFYFPTDDNSRDSSFHPRHQVQVYGSFCGTEMAIDDRMQVDWNENDSIEPWEFFCESILSGDIGNPEDSLDNTYHIIRGTGADSTAVFNGFRISGGVHNVSSGVSIGGGGVQKAYLDSCIIENCYSFWGGGLDASDGSHCLIQHNSALQGGGASQGTFKYCTFYGNTANGHEGGGAIVSNVSHCTFIKNAAPGWVGGGISNYYSFSNKEYRAINCTFIDNSAEFQGTAAYGYKVINCRFFNNRNSYAIAHDTAINCVFTNNEKVAYKSLLINCTVAHNAEGPNKCNLKNCLLWRNSYNINTVNVSYTLSNQGNIPSGNNHVYQYILDQAKIVNPSDSIGGPVKTEEGLKYIMEADWSFKSGSVCINKGNNSVINPWLDYLDLKGNPRIDQDIVDVGAYEYNRIVVNHPMPIIEDHRPFKVYPTLTSDRVNIDCQLTGQTYALQIFTLNGKTLFNETGKKGSCSLDLSSLVPGMYFIRAKLASGENQVFRVIKQ